MKCAYVLLFFLLLFQSYQTLSYAIYDTDYDFYNIDNQIIRFISTTKKKVAKAKQIALYKEAFKKAVLYRVIFLIQMKDEAKPSLYDIGVELVKDNQYVTSAITHVELMKKTRTISFHSPSYKSILLQVIEVLKKELDLRLEYINIIEQYEDFFIIYLEAEEKNNEMIISMMFTENYHLLFINSFY